MDELDEDYLPLGSMDDALQVFINLERSKTVNEAALVVI